MSHDGDKLRNCIRLVFPGQDPRAKALRSLADYLCNISSSTQGPRSASAHIAAHAVKGLPHSTDELSKLMKGTAVFHLQQINGGETIIQLDAGALVREAKSATKTGILLEECRPAVGYVEDVHPIRPGQPNCPQWVKFAECKFGQRCVYNHPELPGSIAQKFRAAQRAIASKGSSAANTGKQTQAVPTTPKTAATAAPASAAASHTAHNAAGSASTTAQGASNAGKSTHSAAMTGQMQPAPSSSTTAPAPAGPDSTDATAAAAAAEAGKSSSAAVCPMLLMRGVCIVGPRCPYSHPTGGSRAATPEVSRSATPEPLNHTAAAAAAPTYRADSAAAASSALGVQPAPPAAAAGSSSSSFQQQQQQEPLNWQQQQYQQPQQQYDDHDGENHFTWQQQQQHQQTIKQQKAQQMKTHYKHQAQQQNQFPITGSTPEGLPHRPGAPNCPYYMHIGICKFGQACVYHHMDCPPQPIKYVTEGYAAGRWHSHKPVSFSRIIMHINRLWDYSTSPAAQLKIWLAYHLISAANPACKMWERSAAAAIAADDYVEGAEASGSSGEDGGSPMGRYSCDLCKAGLFLQKLWREQPDPEAAAEPMPYSKKLRQLFSSDLYFQVTASPHSSSHCYVRLNVAKVVETLNW